MMCQDLAELAKIYLVVYNGFEREFMVHTPFSVSAEDLSLLFVRTAKARALARRIHGMDLQDLLGGKHNVPWQHLCRSLCAYLYNAAREYHGGVDEEDARRLRTQVWRIFATRGGIDTFGFSNMSKEDMSRLLHADLDHDIALADLARIASGNQLLPNDTLMPQYLASLVMKDDTLERECYRIIVRKIDEDRGSSIV